MVAADIDNTRTVQSGDTIRIGLLVSHLREEEKLLLNAAQQRGLDMQVLKDRSLVLDLTSPSPPPVDIVLDRCIAHTRGSYILQTFDRWGIPTVNSSSAVTICDDKAAMSTLLALEGVPTLRTAVAFSTEGAMEVAEQFGYPLVIKPVSGSWGRLMARASSPAMLKTILEQKQQLGSPQHGVFYLQEYVEKPGRDIRVFVIGGEVIAASYRSAEHWITNVARGAVSTVCPVTEEIEDISLQAINAVGAEIAGVDLIETPDGVEVIEVNSGVEFKGLRTTTSLSIPDLILDHVVRRATQTSLETVA